MNRSTLLVGAIGGLALVCSAQFSTAKTTQTRVDYTAAIEHASVVYKESRAKCEPLAGQEKDMCLIEAKAAEKRAKASAEADYKGTIKAKTDSRIANADADFMVAKVACAANVGAEKDICVKQAKAMQVNLVADAKNKTAVVARAEAREDTHEAQHKLELAKCDAMSGAKKDTCVTSAKSAYGK